MASEHLEQLGMVKGCWSPYYGPFQSYLYISMYHIKITFLFAFL